MISAPGNARRGRFWARGADQVPTRHPESEKRQAAELLRPQGHAQRPHRRNQSGKTYI